jgi:hypothetical protein
MNLNTIIKKLSTVISRIEKYQNDKKTNEMQFEQIDKNLKIQQANYEKLKVELSNILQNEN